jgi:thioesterase domain-containing protein
MADLKQLEAKLQINEHSLDVALREHPDLFYKVASELALAISNRDEAKQDLGVVEAAVDMEVRAEAARMNEKTTEKEVQSQVKLDKKVVSANDKYLAESLNAAKWAALKEAYESRSYALSKLVDLFIANYYSSNEGSKTGATAFRETQANHIKDHNKRKRVEV